MHCSCLSPLHQRSNKFTAYIPPDLHSVNVLQSSWPTGQYAAAVVAVHLTFALLEKQRLENFEQKGEVSILSLVTCPLSEKIAPVHTLFCLSAQMLWSFCFRPFSNATFV